MILEDSGVPGPLMDLIEDHFKLNDELDRVTLRFGEVADDVPIVSIDGWTIRTIRFSNHGRTSIKSTFRGSIGKSKEDALLRLIDDLSASRCDRVVLIPEESSFGEKRVFLPISSREKKDATNAHQGLSGPQAGSEPS